MMFVVTVYLCSLVSSCCIRFYFFFFLLIPPPPRSTLFPYTTLFRSIRATQLAIFHEVCLPSLAIVKKPPRRGDKRSEEHTSELQSRFDLVCRLLLEKKKKNNNYNILLSMYQSQNYTSYRL